nr:uncharacterized protein LOC118680705 [Bactrocera oleae]
MLLPTNSTDKKWDENIRCVQWCINTMKNSTTGCTPHELLYGYKPRDILRNRIILSLQANDEALDGIQLTNLRETAAKRINETRAAAKSRFNAKHRSPSIFQEGDLVLAENEPPSTGTSRKLEPRFKGPFVVTKVLDHDRYVVEDLPQTRRTRKHYSSVYSIDKLKRRCQLPEDNDAEEEDIDNNELIGVAQVGQERPTVNE